MIAVSGLPLRGWTRAAGSFAALIAAAFLSAVVSLLFFLRA